MQRSLIAIVAAIVLLCGFAVFLAADRVDLARENAYFGERVRYARHFPPPSDIEQLYADLGFHPNDIRAGASVPRRFLSRLPDSLNALGDNAERKQAFIAVLLPLILRTNELVLEDRARLFSLSGRIARQGRLSPRERRWLLALARGHGLKVAHVSEIDFRILKRRVDAVPISIALAQAAIESGWGTSRFAREGNAIYGQWTWDDSHEGIVPTARGAEETHRIRAFAYLIDSVRGYVRNLNRNPAYVRFRELRERESSAGEGPPDSLALAGTLIAYSTRREAYVADLKAIIGFNRLKDFDRARLAPRHDKRVALRQGPSS